jgi:hypothetical protein
MIALMGETISRPVVKNGRTGAKTDGNQGRLVTKISTRLRPAAGKIETRVPIISISGHGVATERDPSHHGGPYNGFGNDNAP